MGFFLRDPKKEISIIQCQIYISKYNNVYKYYTGLKIDPNNWDKNTHRPKIKRGKEGDQNRKISKILNEYDEVLDLLKEYHGKNLTQEIIKREFDKTFKKIDEDIQTGTVSDCFKLFIKEKQTLGSFNKTSIEKYKRVYKKLFQFKPNLIDFEELNSSFFIDFISYLRTIHELSDNTLNRYLGFFKTFLNWAVKNNYTDNLEYKEHQIKKRETSHVALTSLEIEKLENAQLDERLNFSRDVFLIGIYSGQRFSDYSKISKANFKSDHLEIRQKKTNHICKIPLHDKLRSLLEKYDYSYPRISSQKFNKNIQKICKIIGIDTPIVVDTFYGSKKITKTFFKWQKIGSHTARRTFITVSTQKGLSYSDIMRITGIREVKTLQNYDIDDHQSLKDSVNKIWS